jgi:mannose/cellobiose epimerase-like protein (N-acyl-D-glucosamine 2-epimerase family)
MDGHVRNDLLGYWSQVITSGQAASGAFPGQLCDDGGLRNPPACRAGAARYLVSQSRQVYSYTVAFQMTDDPQYLAFAKAGIAEMEAQFTDPATGLYSSLPGGAAVLDAQQQAYGLLGPSYYAYVTGDADVQARVEATAATISATFRDPATGAWGKTGTPAAGDTLRLVDQLDQLNAYMTLMAATAPEAATRAAFLQDGLETAAFILDNFSFDDPASGLIKQATTASESDGANYGYAIKALWFVDQIAVLAGDDALSQTARDRATVVLGQAMQADGAWAGGLRPDGTPETDVDWWGYAEIDQFAASLALASGDPALIAQVEAAQLYWLNTYVDPDDHGIYASIDILTWLPNLTGTEPSVQDRKQTEWHAGFHSFEHALISYMTQAGIAGEDVTLYFGENADPSLLPYGFSYAALSVSPVNRDGAAMLQATYSGLTYTTLTAVPLPAGAVLLLSALGLLVRRRKVA